ncbi:MAG: porin [Acidobacteriota bacterium]
MKKNLLTVLIISAGLLFFSASTLNAYTGGDDEGKIDTTDGILKLVSKDGKFAYKLDARLYLDAAVYSEDESLIDLHSGSEVRRMRFALKTTLWTNFIAEIDFDFAGNEVDIKDAYMGYKKNNMLFKVGNFRSPFSLEEVTSSRYVSFIERGLPNAFPPGRKLGVALYKWGKNWQAAGGIFGQEPGDIDEKEGENSDEGYSLVGRATFAPIFKDNKIFHIGAAYAYQTTDAFTEKMRFRGYDESKISKIRFLSTGKVKDVKSSGMYGLETALQLGSFHLQAEYMGVNVARLADSGKSDYSLSGGYIFGSFFLTGDSMPYYADQGEFGRVNPKKKGGAIELLARYSWVNLNDLAAGIEGGEGKNFTLGLSWYLNPNYKIMLNYTSVDHDQYADADGDWDVPETGFDYSVFAMRLLVTF